MGFCAEPIITSWGKSELCCAGQG